MEEATGEAATERFVEKEEGGCVEDQMINRIVLPDEAEPARDFAIEQGRRKKIVGGGTGGWREIEKDERKNEDQEFGWIF